MHLLVLGATGAIGTIFCRLATGEGHQLTLFVRTPEKIPEDISRARHVTVIEGQLDDETSLEEAASCGATVFVSFAGPPHGTKGTPLVDGYKTLLPKLATHGFLRSIVLCTPSFRREQDKASFKWRFGGWFMRTFSRGQYWEMVGVGNYVSSLPTDTTMKWTLFRIGGLTDDGTPDLPVMAKYLGESAERMWISRRSVANWVMEEIAQENWLHGVPYIWNC